MGNEGERSLLKKLRKTFMKKGHGEICLSLRSFYEGLLFRLA